MSLPVAILAGGLATRLRPITEKIPKVLMEVGGLPFAVHQLELLRRRGLKRVIFCVGFLGKMVQSTLGDGRQWGMELTYVFDGETLLGTGGALRQALPALGKAFFVMYGDSYLPCDYASAEQSFLASGKLGLMTVFRNAGKWDHSNVLFQNGRIICYDKQNPLPAMQYIDYGLGVLKSEALSPYKPDTYLDLATVYKDLLAQNQLAGFETTQRFYEIGSLEGLKETHAYLMQKK